MHERITGNLTACLTGQLQLVRQYFSYVSSTLHIVSSITELSNYSHAATVAIKSDFTRTIRPGQVDLHAVYRQEYLKKSSMQAGGHFSSVS